MTKALLCRLLAPSCLVVAVLLGADPAKAARGSIRVLERWTYLRPGIDTVFHIAEFTDSNGKTIHSLSLENEKESDLLLSVEAIASKNGQLLVLTKKTSSVSDRNPYLARKNLDSEISWYRADGTRIGNKKYFWTATAVAVSSEGTHFAVLDAGFNPFDGDSEPDLSRATEKDRLIDLSYHAIEVLDLNGKVAWSERITDRSTDPPREFAFSPLGSWMIYSLGGDTHLVNIRTKMQEQFTGDRLNWEVNERGHLTAWRTEGKDGEWIDFEGRRAWKPTRELLQRKHIRAPGEATIQKLEETRIFNRDTGSTRAP